jgi:hypothetical protein
LCRLDRGDREDEGDKGAKSPSSPQPLLPNLGEGEPERIPSPFLGEGFRVRAKTMVLNIDEV